MVEGPGTPQEPMGGSDHTEVQGLHPQASGARGSIAPPEPFEDRMRQWRGKVSVVPGSY